MVEGRPRRVTVLGSLFLIGVSLSTARPAAADFATCVDANASAQGLQHQGKFTAARAQLRVCVDASCPDVVRTDCAQRQEELERLQPTIVFDVQDSAHQDVVQVDISVDGQKVADKVDGLALRVDPGVHTFSFEAPGHVVTTTELVIHEGEKLRTARVVLIEPAAGPPPAALGPAPSSSGHKQRVAGVVTGAVGVAGVALGSVFGLLASSALSKSRTECSSPTMCPQHPGAVSDYQNASTDGTVSTVGFIAGAVLVGGGVTLFLTARSAAPARSALGSTPTLALAPSVDARAAALWLLGTF